MNRRLVAEDFMKPLAMVETPIPEAPPTGMIIKVAFAGICHSDALMWEKPLTPVAKDIFPVVLGHEVSGTVHSIGEEKVDGAGEFSVGDRVMLFPWGGCMECDVCVSGSQHCHNRNGPHAHAYGVWQDGGFQQYLRVLNRTVVAAVPESVPLDVAALLPCSGVTTYHAAAAIKDVVDYSTNIRGFTNVLMIGAGGLGLWAIQIVKAMYPQARICSADIAEDKLKEAKEAGADFTLCWDKEANAHQVAAQVKEVFDGKPVDACIDLVGMSSTVERAFWTIANGGTMILVGIFGGMFPSVPLIKAALGNIRIEGVYVGSQDQLQQLTTLVKDKKVNPPPINHIGLEDVQGIMDEMLKGGSQIKGRNIVKFA